jgi:lysozyme
LASQIRSFATGAGSALTLAATLVMAFEGYIPAAYMDPVGISTACYGHTGPDVTPGKTYTKEECDRLLHGDLAEAYAAVQQCVRVPLKPTQSASLVSLAFNIGGNAFCGSTLVKRINAGELPAACAEISRWHYARGISLRGLVKRRAAERQLCEAA